MNQPLALLVLCMQQEEPVEVACPEHIMTHDQGHNAGLQRCHRQVGEGSLAGLKLPLGQAPIESRASKHRDC